MKKIRMLLADDHEVVREGIKNMIRLQNKFKAKIDEAENGDEAIKRAIAFDYDIIIIDIKMPKVDGIEATQKIISKKPDSKILALSMFNDEGYIRAILKAGALGYILKNAGSEEINNGITKVLQGERYYSNDVAVKLIVPYEKMVLEEPDKNFKFKKENTLFTERETEVLQLIADGLTNEQISDKLNIARRTVETHRRNMMNKIDVNSMAELLRYAYKNQIL